MRAARAWSPAAGSPAWSGASYPRWVLWGACALLIVANVFNIGADLGGMAEATEMVTGIRSY